MENYTYKNCESIYDIFKKLVPFGMHTGKVVKVLEFGAFVNLLPKTDGFLHISELTKDRGVDINTLIKEGELVNVKLVSIDDKGRLKLAKIN